VQDFSLEAAASSNSKTLLIEYFEIQSNLNLANVKIAINIDITTFGF